MDGDATANAARPQRRRMGRPTLSNEELLGRALDLFLEKGFERTSIEAIASAAGMAKRTIYARYRDKETLFRAALKRAIEEWIVPVERLKEAEQDDLEETLLTIGGILVANIMRPAGLRLMRLTNAVSGQMPDIGAENVQQGTAPTVAYLADLFRRQVGRMGERTFSAEEAATAFLHLVAGGPSSVAAWGVRLTQAEVDRHTRNSVRLFLHGLLPREVSRGTTEDDDRRLRQLLTDALLENVALKERLGSRVDEAARSATGNG